MALIAVLGFSSGLPLKLVFVTLTLWLVDVGIDKSTVGLFALASLPYNFKFLWAPAIDGIRIPFLGNLLGRRRSWLLVTQLALMGSLMAMAFTDPFSNVLPLAIATLVTAFLSASQDIAFDAYRVELLDDDEQGAGAAAAVFGYRLGMLAAGAGALRFADFFEKWPRLMQWHHTFHDDSATYADMITVDAWTLTYACMAALMLVGVIATLVARRSPAQFDKTMPFDQRLEHQVIEPFRDLIRRKGWVMIVALVLLFKLSDALANAMTNPFLDELGFTKLEIADIRDTYGLIASLVGAALGGLIVRAVGIKRSLYASLILMMASNLLFSVQAQAGHSNGLLVVVITGENVTGGFGTAALVAYLSSLTSRDYTATQYALLTSLSSVARTFLGATAGLLAEELGWFLFFAFTAVTSIPALAILPNIRFPATAPADEDEGASG